MKKHRFGLGVLTGILISVLVMGCIGAGYLYSMKSADVASKTSKKIALLEKAIDTYYMGEINKEDEAEGIYAGLIAGLKDPYSQYFTAKEYSEKQEEDSGTYAGIGAGVNEDKKTGYTRITEVYKGSPAEKAGLKKDDMIVKVNGKAVDGQSVDQVVSKIRGEAGTAVNVRVFRTSANKFIDLKIVRDHVDVTSAAATVVDKNYGIGYMRIAEFNETTYKQFKKELTKLKKKKVKGIIFDVRSNPGGMLTTICKVLDDLVPEGKIITVKDKNGHENSITSGPEQIEVPCVVLVDGNTASAAELFSGAMQDYKKGVIIGEQTYGKGVVQNTYPLTDGSAIKLTVEKYFTPKGQDINKKGITPDIKVSNTANEDLQFKRGLEELKKKIAPAKYKKEQSKAKKAARKKAAGKKIAGKKVSGKKTAGKKETSKNSKKK